MSQIKNRTVLITGGASGIGKIMGELFLEEGAKKLIIWDINAVALKETLDYFSAKKFAVSTYVVDLSDLAQIQTVFSEMSAKEEAIDILINNAGIIVGKSFLEHSASDIDRTMQVNTLSLMHLARLLLPSMTLKKQGHIVNIASAAALVANPLMSVYCGSKWAVVGWSDSLRLELQRTRSGVQVTTVLPYYIDTGMFNGVTSPIIPILKPQATAKRILKAVKKGTPILYMPWILKLVPLLQGLLSTALFDLVVGKCLGVYKSMEHFKGSDK